VAAVNWRVSNKLEPVSKYLNPIFKKYIKYGTERVKEERNVK